MSRGEMIVIALSELRNKVNRYDQDIGDIQNRLMDLIDILIMAAPTDPPAKPKSKAKRSKP